MTAEPSAVPGIFVDNTWQPAASDRSLTAICPASEEPLGEVPDGGAADVDAAVRSARAAFDDPAGWPSWPAERRAEVMEALAAALSTRRASIAELVSSENGMPVSLARAAEAATPPALLRYYARLVRDHGLEEVRRGPGGATTVVRNEPVGVVGAIVPWNYPQSLAAFKYAPALAAGCTLVLKPSPETTLDLMLFAEAVQEVGLPPGVVTIVPGGRATGAALVDHPDLDKIAFTGSTAAGRIIAETCARRLRPATLELGGKSAAIILDDADLGDVQGLFMATMLNTGQTCYLCTRILAPRQRYQEVVDLVAAMAGGLVVGDPLDPSTQVGPVATAAQRARVERAIASGRSDGFRLVAGGGRPAGFERGYFVQPTVFADVDNRSELAREEIFGPVLAVIPYDGGDDQAVALANDSDYGLGGTVWSTDPERALGVARRVRTGSIGINGYRLDLGAPFGGVKASGFGRELGPEGMAAYLRTKSVYRL